MQSLLNVTTVVSILLIAMVLFSRAARAHPRGVFGELAAGGGRHAAALAIAAGAGLHHRPLRHSRFAAHLVSDRGHACF